MNMVNGFAPIPAHLASILRSEGVQRMADDARRFVEAHDHNALEDAKQRATFSLMLR